MRGFVAFVDRAFKWLPGWGKLGNLPKLTAYFVTLGLCTRAASAALMVVMTVAIPRTPGRLSVDQLIVSRRAARA